MVFLFKQRTAYEMRISDWSSDVCASDLDDVFTPMISLHWMGAWPHDDAQAAALIAYGGTLAAVGGAVSVTTKSTHEAFGLPTPEKNAEGLRITRMGIYLARHTRLDGLSEEIGRASGRERVGQ